MTPTCYRALDRYGRGWGWVHWTHSEVISKLAFVDDLETGESYPVDPRDLRVDWEKLPRAARDVLMTLPPVVQPGFIAEKEGAA